ncbi:MAG: SlyX family protein [Sneathiellales bacterium]|nr:SlyX family protein [Sneathiellales bacterium]
MTDLEKRLNELEMQLAEQDRTLQDMSEMVSQQWDEIDRLKRKLTTASERIVSLEENLPQNDQIEKPPHY